MVEELRIGNWILEDETVYAYGTQKKERQWEFVDFRTCYEVGSDFYDMFKPIPLTEEWLLKFGFEYIREAMGYADSLHIVYEYKEGFCFHPFCTNDEDCHIMIKHVHQLQNLYFALTGKEL